MPIRPENRARYPKNWKSEIVPRIRARSGNRCECTGQCGISHGVRDDQWDERCRWRHDQWKVAEDGKGGEVKVILTVMHLNHQPEDCRDENLLHACQGCHNRYDMPKRAADRKARLKAARASGDLFQCEGVS